MKVGYGLNWPRQSEGREKKKGFSRTLAIQGHFSGSQDGTRRSGAATACYIASTDDILS
jgi:hypothetical protein